jgi:hypothetical protein
MSGSDKLKVGTSTSNQKLSDKIKIIPVITPATAVLITLTLVTVPVTITLTIVQQLP